MFIFIGIFGLLLTIKKALTKADLFADPGSTNTFVIHSFIDSLIQ